MKLTHVLSGKIHGATVTSANLDYEGSLTIPIPLLEASGIEEYEAVHVWNVTNGSRLQTYAIKGLEGSNDICANGAAAHLIHPRDKVIIAAFTWCDKSSHTFLPKVVFVNQDNNIKEIRTNELADQIAPGGTVESDEIPDTHPRRLSLMARSMLTEGVDLGITSRDGLIAHGRGEAFDYLLGERTHPFAVTAAEAAAARILSSKKTAISINGNVAALCAAQLESLREATQGVLEVNLFHASVPREQKIRAHLLRHGAAEVLLPTRECVLPGLDSNRRFLNSDGMMSADTIIVPLEDGNKCEALIKQGKFVIAVDLNPLSRTARMANITIVDNITRVIPLLVEKLERLKSHSAKTLEEFVTAYDNQKILQLAENAIRKV